LSLRDVGAPRLYTANRSGAALVDFLPADTRHPANFRMLAAWDDQLRGWLDQIEQHLRRT
jgi:hypothetical protein